MKDVIEGLKEIAKLIIPLPDCLETIEKALTYLKAMDEVPNELPPVHLIESFSTEEIKEVITKYTELYYTASKLIANLKLKLADKDAEIEELKSEYLSVDEHIKELKSELAEKKRKGEG